MIDKLRRKLKWLLFLLPMMVFSVAFVAMMGNTVDNVRESEMQWAENMAQTIVEEIDKGSSIADLNLELYATKANAWVQLTAGEKTYTTEETKFYPSEDLLQELKNGHHSLQVATLENGETQKSSSIYATGSYIGVVTSALDGDTIAYELTLIIPRTTSWEVVQDNAVRYLVLWGITAVLIYLLGNWLSKKAVQPVAAAMKSQKEFIAAASHELKTPLAVIQANAEAIEPGKRQNMILDECSRMGDLIGTLLSLAASDAGNWKMDIRPTDMDTLLIEVWEKFTEYASRKQIPLKLNIDESYPAIPCDKERIGQVLGILLDNAIAHSKQGQSVEIFAKLQSKHIVLSVVDHGPGIPDDKKKKVFERFYSGDYARSEKGHYGLGLSIAKEILECHKGDIVLKDTPNGGCTVEVYLPIQNSPSALVGYQK